MKWGLELWNRPDGGQADEWERVRALGGGCIKVRTYHPTSLLHEARPELVLLRRESDTRIDIDGQIRDARPWIEACRQQKVRLVYILDNEPNHPQSYYKCLGAESYAAALQELSLCFRFTYPDVAQCAPPLVVNCDDLAWLQAIRRSLNGLKAKMEYYGAHSYWQGDNYRSPDWGKRIERYAEILPGVRWIVDEVGDATEGRDIVERATTTLYVLDYLQRRGDVEAACVFIAGGTDDWRQYWLPPAELAHIGQTLTAVQWEHVPQPDPEPPAAPEPTPTKEDTPLLARIGNGYEVVDRRSDLPRNGDFPYRPLSAIRYIVIHHTVTSPNISTKALADYHMQPHGTEPAYPGIAYTFVIGPDGLTEWCNPLEQEAYAVLGRNQESLSVCLKGDFTDTSPPDAQIAATKRLGAELQYALGWFVPIVGHREVALSASPTACPGDTFLPYWKSRVVTVAPVTMPTAPKPPDYQFVLGFGTLAARLGNSVVGEPLENEHKQTFTGMIQKTSTGVMIWSEGDPATFWKKVA